MTKTNNELMKEIRASLGWSTAELARWMGITRRAVQHWEKGSRKCPDAALSLALFIQQEHKIDNSDKNG